MEADNKKFIEKLANELTVEEAMGILLKNHIVSEIIKDVTHGKHTQKCLMCISIGVIVRMIARMILSI